MKLVLNEDRPHTNVLIKSLIHKGKDKEQEYTLKPQDSVIFMTDEIQIADSQLGFLFDKNDHWRNGLMITCTKLVHPGYSGPVSGLITNIGEQEYLLHIDDKILELLIFEGEKSLGHYPDHLKKTVDEYKKDLKKVSIKFPLSFINVKQFESSLNKKLDILTWGNWAKVIVFVVSTLTILGVGLAFFEHMTHERINGYISTVNNAQTLQENAKDKAKKIK